MKGLILVKSSEREKNCSSGCSLYPQQGENEIFSDQLEQEQQVRGLGERKTREENVVIQVCKREVWEVSE